VDTSGDVAKREETLAGRFASKEVNKRSGEETPKGREETRGNEPDLKESGDGRFEEAASTRWKQLGTLRCG
jgi:hypothetical protein